jgi:hypothetical protein
VTPPTKSLVNYYQCIGPIILVSQFVMFISNSKGRFTSTKFALYRHCWWPHCMIVRSTTNNLVKRLLQPRLNAKYSARIRGLFSRTRLTSNHGYLHHVSDVRTIDESRPTQLRRSSLMYVSRSIKCAGLNDQQAGLQLVKLCLVSTTTDS